MRYNEGDVVLKIILATVIVAIVAAGALYAVLKRKMDQGNVYTEEEKLEVLEQLTKESKPQPSVVERSRILEKLRIESKQ
jgi:uncharacterized protein YxeA